MDTGIKFRWRGSFAYTLSGKNGHVYNSITTEGRNLALDLMTGLSTDVFHSVRVSTEDEVSSATKQCVFVRTGNRVVGTAFFDEHEANFNIARLELLSESGVVVAEASELISKESGQTLTVERIDEMSTEDL